MCSYVYILWMINYIIKMYTHTHWHLSVNIRICVYSYTIYRIYFNNNIFYMRLLENDNYSIYTTYVSYGTYEHMFFVPRERFGRISTEWSCGDEKAIWLEIGKNHLIVFYCAVAKRMIKRQLSKVQFRKAIKIRFEVNRERLGLQVLNIILRVIIRRIT